jgi:hypothetical protein
MVLGYFVKGLTYPKSLYHSTTPYSFFYYQYSLAMPFWMWTHVDHKWLADLYGLSFEKKSPPKGLDAEAAWNEYVGRLTGYLKKGLPVQTYLGWAAKEEDEKRGKIVTSTGLHAYWWEGLSRKTRPDTHSFVVVGLDKANDVVWFNAPAAGWRGLPKYADRPLSRLTHTMRNLRPDLKYATMAYLRTDRTPKDRKTVEELVRKRIVKKLKGDPAAYVKNPPKRYLYGINALKGLKADLTPDRFVRIIEGRMKKRNVPAVEVPVGMKLAFYQHKFMASLAAEYLESQRQMEEWEWLSKLAILYEQLYIDSVKLVPIVMSTNDKKKWARKSAPILKDMRRTIDETVKHMQQYLGTKGTRT